MVVLRFVKEDVTLLSGLLFVLEYTLASRLGQDRGENFFEEG